MQPAITSEVVVAYAQCPRKAYLLLFPPAQDEPHEYVRILLANPLQRSRSTFSWESFPSFFAFQEGMWGTQISALLSSPTVSLRFVRLQRDQRLHLWYIGKRKQD